MLVWSLTSWVTLDHSRGLSFRFLTFKVGRLTLASLVRTNEGMSSAQPRAPQSVPPSPTHGRFRCTGRSQDGRERPPTASEKARDTDGVEGSRSSPLIPTATHRKAAGQGRAGFLSPYRVCPPTFSGHVLNVDLVFVGHVTEDGKDGKPRDEAGDTVDGAGEQGVPGGEENHGVKWPDAPTLLPKPCTV